jgi:hypothetical protein
VSFPLAAGTTVERRPAGLLLRAGGAAVVLRQVDGPALRLVVDDLEVSPAYGAFRPSVCLRAELAIGGTTRWAFEFAVTPAAGRR